MAEDPERGARLLAASDAVLRVEHIVRGTDQKEYDEIRARIATSVDEETFARIHAETGNIGIAAAIAYALEEPEGPDAREE